MFADNYIMIFFLRFAALTFVFTLFGCITIDIKPKEMGVASQTSFSPPKGDYTEERTPASDHTWIDKKNKIKISFVSECGSVSSMNLNAIASSVIAPTAMKLEKQSSIDRNGNPALVSYASRKDVGMKVKLVTEKTSTCIYNFAVLSPLDKFEKAEADFDAFLAGVKTQ